MANKTITYLLWFFFGWSGLHHLYLGRLNHAIVWFTTLGGGCGIGWIRDVWRIPDYLDWCNNSRSSRPKCSWFRFVGMIVMGYVMSTVLGSLVPDTFIMSEDTSTYYIIKFSYMTVVLLGNAIGVYLVANIGELQCTKKCPFLISFLITPWFLDKNPNLVMPCFITAFVTWYKGMTCRPVALHTESVQNQNKIFCKNVMLYFFACTAWLLVLGAGFYFNAYVTMENGEKIPAREALNNFFKSEAWKKAKDSFYRVFSIYWHDGAGRAWRDAMTLLDFSGEKNAFKVLGLPHGSSQSVLTKHCRKMLAQNHPDRFKIQTEKDVAQEKFIEIQQACSILLKSRAH